MEFEFDKEIDFLLRQTARNGDFVSNNTAEAHLDADEIAAFAENALPEKTRQMYLRHLADCDRCRKSLSYSIQLNSEIEPETVHAEEKTLAAAPEIPWYRRLFAFPNLAYTLGALVLIFSGIAVFTVLQSTKNTSFEMSKTLDKQPNGKGMSDSGTDVPTETYASNSATSANKMSANTMMTNSTSSSAANFSAIPAAPSMTANSNAPSLSEKAGKDSKSADKPASPKELDDLVAKTENAPFAGAPPPAATAPAPTPSRDNDFTLDGEILRQQNQSQSQQNTIIQNQSADIITPDSRNVKRAPLPALRAEGKSRKAEESREDNEAEKSKSAATTSVGGKTFKRENNVWYDTAYRGQQTKNITRGTNEYKKLDAGLRGIAENLGGTVVVVWKQKAYRIQ